MKTFTLTRIMVCLCLFNWLCQEVLACPTPKSRWLSIVYDANVGEPGTGAKPLLNASTLIMYAPIETRPAGTTCGYIGPYTYHNPYQVWNSVWQGNNYWKMTKIPGTFKWVIEFNIDSLYGDASFFSYNSQISPDDTLVSMEIQFRDELGNTSATIEVTDKDKAWGPTVKISGLPFSGLTCNFFDETAGADLEMVNTYNLDEYQQVPFRHIQGNTRIAAKGKNNGPLLANSPKIILNAQDPMQVYPALEMRILEPVQLSYISGASNVPIIKDLPKDIIDVFTPNDLAAAIVDFGSPGWYNLDFNLSSQQPDTLLQNNSMTQNFYLSDTVMARDNGIMVNSLIGGNGYPFEYGHVIKIHKRDTLTSISGMLVNPPVGQQMAYKVYDFNGSPGSLIATSTTYVTTIQDQASTPGSWITLGFSPKVALDTGTYFISFNQMDNQPLNLAYADSNYTPGTVFLKAGITPWADIGNATTLEPALMLRANFGTEPSIEVNPQNYCPSGASSSADSRIDQVILLGETHQININTATVNNTYSDFTQFKADLTLSKTYPVGILLGTTGFTQYPKTSKILVDWNQDNDFDDSNEVFDGPSYISGEIPSLSYHNITVPDNAKLGATMMRIVCWEHTCCTQPSANFCGIYSYGETEDYTLEVIDRSYCFSSANIDGSPIISKVELSNTLDALSNNTEDSCGDYSDFTNLSLDVAPGSTVNAKINIDGCGQSSDYGSVGVFVDWEGDFDFGSPLFTANSVDSVVSTFNVPANIPSGPKRMRVVMIFTPSGGGDPTEPCGLFVQGEVEDYTLNVLNYNDIRVSSIDNPGTDCGSANTPITITLCNEGLTAQSNIPVSVSTGDSIFTYTHTGTIQPGNCVQANVGSLNTLEGGVYTIIAEAQLANDQVSDNDRQFKTITFYSTASPAVTADTACGVANLTLSAQANSQFAGPVYWYDSQGTNVGIGSQYYTPLLNTTTIYYAQVGITTGCPSSQAAAAAVIDPLPNISAQGTDPLCASSQDGTASVSILSVIPPYSINWDNGFTGPNLVNLTGGTYAVTVTDDNGCMNTDSVTLFQPSPITVSPVEQPVSCFGGNNGTITVNAGGGTSSLSYSLDGSNYVSSAVFSNLSAGTYTVYVKDANNCLKTAVATISQPPQLTLATSALQVDCSGGNTGSITLTAGGGMSGYAYSINGGSYGPINTFTNLSAGTYAVSVQDANGCVVSITETITEPSPISLAANTTSVSCFGSCDGSISVTASGGTQGFIYSLNGTVYFTNSQFVGLCAGTYTVYVQDANNCLATTVLTISEPAQININPTATSVSCAGGSNGSITVGAAGGTPGYMYSLNGTNYSLGNVFGSLVAGSYTVYVKDANNCTESTSVVVSEPTDLITTQLQATQAQCNTANGSLVVQSNGGVGPYQYAIDGGPFSSSGAFSNLTAGGHIISTQDQNGCMIDTVFTISSPNSPAGSISNLVPVSCFGLHDGSIVLAASGGAPTYLYSLDSINFSTNPVITGLEAGSYTAYIKDANQCGTQVQFTITEPDLLKIIVDSVKQIDCYGDNTGEIRLSGTGGTPAYTFSALGGILADPNGDFLQLEADAYDILLTDVNSCSVDTIISIIQADSIVIAESIIDESCPDANDGEINLQISGGTAPYEYQINQDSAGTNNANLSSGVYDIVITDANDCLAILPNLTVGTADSLPTADFDFTRNGYEVSFNNLSSSNAQNFFWDFGDGTTNTDPNPVHTYASTISGDVTVTLIANNNCGSDTFEVTITSVSIQDGFGKLPIDFLDVYPNPTNGIFTLKLRLTKADLLEIAIYDLMGKRIMRTEEAIVQYLERDFDLNNEAEGIYYLSLKMSEGTFVRKIEIR